MSFSEELIGAAFDEAGFKLRDNTNEYYTVPLQAKESKSHRATRVKNLVVDTLFIEEMDCDWEIDGNINNYALNENVKTPSK